MKNNVKKQNSVNKSDLDFSNLRALFLNCTLKKSDELSHTEGLINVSKNIFDKNGIQTEVIRPVDHKIAFGVQKDMREHGWSYDEWPEIYKKIEEADILIIGTPIWLGDKSSVCTQAIERLYSSSADLNSSGQYAYYGKVGGCLITGNEDGAKHCAMNILYSLQHIGFLIPPQADAAWLGEVGPGPSYLDEGSGGPENDFTNRNTTFMTWNLMHFAKLLKDAGGVPAYGNQRSAWDSGERFGFEKIDAP